MIPQCYPTARSRLSCQSKVLHALNAQLLLELDCATDIKHHRAWHIGLLRLDRIPQTALAAVFEVRHMKHIPTASSRCESAITFGSRKSDEPLSPMKRGEEHDEADECECLSHGWNVLFFLVSLCNDV